MPETTTWNISWPIQAGYSRPFDKGLGDPEGKLAGKIKTNGGRKTYQTTHPPEFFVGPLQKSFWYAESWISVQEKNRATTLEGV